MKFESRSSYIGHAGEGIEGGRGTESTCAISTLDTRGIREFPDVVVAGIFAVETGLDATTFIFDFRKLKVDFRGNARYIETSDI
jgi:hypothetical protein